MYITILQWNACGLAGHGNELKQFMEHDRQLHDVLFIQETLLKQTNKFTIPGYNIIRQDRQGNRTHGGLATLVRNNLNYIEFDKPDDVESITVRVKTENKYIVIANPYLSPNDSIIKDKFAKLFANNNKMPTTPFGVVRCITAEAKCWMN